MRVVFLDFSTFFFYLTFDILCNFLVDKQDIDGNDVSLGDYKGKVLLIVNVASKW